MSKAILAYCHHHKFYYVNKFIPDSTLAVMELEKDFKLSTIPWNCSEHVVEPTQMKVGLCPLPHTQMHTRNWQIVSTLSLNPMEPLSTSPSSPWI